MKGLGKEFPFCSNPNGAQVVPSIGIPLDYDEVEKLFFCRLDDSSVMISRGFEANFDADRCSAQNQPVRVANL